MTDFPWKPIRFPLDLERRLEETFSELIYEPWQGVGAKSWQPEIDVYETPSEYLIEADLPGVEPNDIQLEVQEHAVTIAGQRSSAQWIQSGQTVRIERRQGSFYRQISLPQAVDPNPIETNHTQGTLHIRLSKKKRKGPHP